MCRLCGEHLFTSRESTNDPATNIPETNGSHSVQAGFVSRDFKALGVQFIGDEEYSNIRSEKIRVLELGISMPTFTPTYSPHFPHVSKCARCNNILKMVTPNVSVLIQRDIGRNMEGNVTQQEKKNPNAIQSLRLWNLNEINISLPHSMQLRGHNRVGKYSLICSHVHGLGNNRERGLPPVVNRSSSTFSVEGLNCMVCGKGIIRMSSFQKVSSRT